MAIQQRPEQSPDRRILDLDSAKAEKRFVEAFQLGKLDKLSPAEQTMFLMAFGRKIGVRAELGELMIYQGKPYITIAGRIRIAHTGGLLAGIQPRPATALEYRSYGASNDEVLWVCDVYRHGSPHAFRGWGVANRVNDRNPVARQFPREMARKRAKYDALALAFPPDETLGPIHQRWIDEAEEIALAERPKALRSPDEMPDVEAEEIGASMEDTGGMSDGAPPPNDDDFIDDRDLAD